MSAYVYHYKDKIIRTNLIELDSIEACAHLGQESFRSLAIRAPRFAEDGYKNVSTSTHGCNSGGE